MKLAQLASELGGVIEGDADLDIRGVAPIETAEPGHLSFLVNLKYLPELKRTRASALIVSEEFPSSNLSLLRHKNAYLAFAKAIEIFNPRPRTPAGIHQTAWVSPNAILGVGASIGAFSWIADGAVLGDRVEVRSHCSIEPDAVIGDDCLLHAGSVVRHGVRIGRRCIIQSNAVIGSDGFGYAKQDDGSWYKILQSGTVVVEDDVEIGAGATVDRASVGETRIRQGAKIDNMVQIGHGSEVGRHTLLCAQVGLAGSTRVGDNVILAGQVGSAGHLTVGDGAMATGQTGIPGDVPPGAVISGSPAIDNKLWLKATAMFSKLPDIRRHLRQLSDRVAKLENTSDK